MSLTTRLFAVGVLAGFAFPLAGCKDAVTREYEGKLKCEEHLRQIQEAKRQWAFETQASPQDTPMWGDLIGEDKYIRESPRCPGNGLYTINPVNEPPTCSFVGENYTHTFSPE